VIRLLLAGAVAVLALASPAAAGTLLHYLLLEATFGPPNSPWSVVTRIHHRSGIFGLFSHSGSNVISAGVRYRF